ncbi:MAG: sigma 54-interacting transcriptional regulator [Myxococcales bacterium]|nr:sigma 54-interacting transcriptional regulator [Myxococcales bacterium]
MTKPGGETTVRTEGKSRGRAPALSVVWPGGFLRVPLGPDVGEVLVGRGEDCQLRVDVPSISRKHARILVDPLTIEDLGSANGTRVSGQLVPPHQKIPIHPGMLVEIGSAVLLVHADPTATPSPSSGGTSMDALEHLTELAAKSDLTLLLRGETGVGKEVLAARIHALSARAARPFLKVNCAALTETLFESELFGHEKGSFTGAVAQKIGYFEAAHGGTLLLDEIGDLSHPMQVKLLRVLEAREIVRVGAVKPRPVDVRVLAATHRDLEEMVAEGTFRRDLYYRLDGLTLHIPPLRERPSDLEALARKFAAAQGRELTAAAVARLRSHPFPGNVRELRNVIARACVLSAGAPIGEVHLVLGGIAMSRSGAPNRSATSSPTSSASASSTRWPRPTATSPRRRSCSACRVVR